MADRGPMPTMLQRKKMEVEISRLEHQISFQELEVMQLHDEIQRKQENIDSSLVEIEKQKEMLANLGPG